MISFNWKDGMKVISLAELEAAMEADDKGEAPILSGFLGSYLDGSAPLTEASKHQCLLAFYFSEINHFSKHFIPL